MTDKPHERPSDEPEELEEELVEEQQSIELPAREAFSLVFSSPTFLHASGIAEQVLPDDPAPEPPA